MLKAINGKKIILNSHVNKSKFIPNLFFDLIILSRGMYKRYTLMCSGVVFVIEKIFIKKNFKSKTGLPYTSLRFEIIQCIFPSKFNSFSF